MLQQTIGDALADMKAAWRHRQTAFAFAAEDVADLYRRTWLGPLWLVLSYLIFVLAITYVAGSPAQENYVVFVACGLLVFNFISETVTEGVELFQRESPFIKGTTLPLSTYIVRLTARSVYRCFYSLIACLAMILASGLPPTPLWIFSALAFVMIVLTAPAAAAIFAVLGALFPDMRFIVQNTMRVMFFLSPVFWSHAGDRVRELFFLWNPITHFIEIFRHPILNGDIALLSWAVAAAVCAVLWIGSLVLLGIYRNRIVFLV